MYDEQVRDLLASTNVGLRIREVFSHTHTFTDDALSCVCIDHDDVASGCICAMHTYTVHTTIGLIGLYGMGWDGIGLLADSNYNLFCSSFPRWCIVYDSHLGMT